MGEQELLEEGMSKRVNDLGKSDRGMCAEGAARIEAGRQSWVEKSAVPAVGDGLAQRD